jgi:hypothetical protein
MAVLSVGRMDIDPLAGISGAQHKADLDELGDVRDIILKECSVKIEFADGRVSKYHIHKISVGKPLSPL